MSSSQSATSAKPLPAEDLRHVVEQVGDWGPLCNKTVVITGSRGFVGQWMLESLLCKYYHGRDLVVETVEKEVEHWWPERKPDYIIHATSDGVGWQHVAHVARAAGAKMLLLSSGAVYGNSAWMPEKGVARKANEDTMALPRDQYGTDKRMQEVKCCDVAVIARLFSFIGPGLRRHAGHEFVTAGSVKVKNDGAVRSYLHAADMATWLWRCLLLGKVGRAYNVGSGEATKVIDFARMCAVERNQHWSTGFEIAPGEGGTYYVPDIGRAERELGCQQAIGLDDAVRRTVAWYIWRTPAWYK
ncbi:MAG: NAD(P)-dependent oxidoreductase [Patescibacteria group bacterium]|nr:NAD(P)-dependent oxidoreductase [Patescibacteria group bacterium]